MEKSIGRKAIIEINLNETLALSTNYIMTAAISTIGSSFMLNNTKYILLTDENFIQIISIDCT